ncbi:MAG: calcium-binding protein, partial [Actinomycetia bacterium]|nr:calcium-binding protein [Actinomycetes bacterium]
FGVPQVQSSIDGYFQPDILVDSILIRTFDGNDRITISGDLAAPAIIDGGAGDDRIDFFVEGDPAAAALRRITVEDSEGDETYTFNASRVRIELQDEAGTDTLDFSALPSSIDLNLSRDSGALQTLGSSQIQLGLTGTFEHVIGTRRNDVILGNEADNSLAGGAGRDRLFGAGGDDTLQGGNGRDLLFGGPGDDLLDGGRGQDILFGGRGDDSLAGGSGNDRLFGGPGDDLLDGGRGDDLLFGGRGNDRLRGGRGDDYLDGGRGFDVALYPGPSSDYDIRHAWWLGTTIVRDRIGDEGTDRLRRIEEIAHDTPAAETLLFNDDGSLTPLQASSSSGPAAPIILADRKDQSGAVLDDDTGWVLYGVDRHALRAP